MKEKTLVEVKITSTPIVAKVKKLSANWIFKQGRSINGHGTEHHYYETVQMSDDVTRYYARGGIAKKLPKKQEIQVMNWLRRKLKKPDNGWIILREGSNFFDVIGKDRLNQLS